MGEESIRLELHGYSAEQVLDAMARDFWNEHRLDAVESAIEKTIKAKLDEAVGTYLKDQIEPKVAAIIDEGWQQTNSYGEKSGPVVTLSTLVRERLVGKGSNSYHDTFAQVCDRMTKAAIEKELAPLIAKARDEITAMLDRATLEKLRAALGGKP
jgi:hypothetical protein